MTIKSYDPDVRAARIEIIRQMAGEHPADEIAAACGISLQWCRQLAQSKGISLSIKYNRWEEGDYELVKGLKAAGLTWDKIGEKFDVTGGAVARWFGWKTRKLTTQAGKANI